MNKFFLFLSFLPLLVTSCQSDKNHPYEGTFTIDTGLKFELRPDSTASIFFGDTSVYNSKWIPVVDKDQYKYATIEFAGYSRYYYLKDGKLYRSEREMRHDAFGQEVSYK